MASSIYNNITSAANDIYSYISNLDFGDEIRQAIDYMYQGSYLLATNARGDAQENCQVTNCDELMKNVNSEIGKAILEYDKENYVNTFNHLTNAWKFAENIMGANLKKASADGSSLSKIPTTYDLSQNYPNPFNPVTKIDYQLPEKNYVTLKIYDILGERLQHWLTRK